VNRKRAIYTTYRTHLEGKAGIAMNPEPEGTVNGAWMPTAVFPESSAVRRESLLRAFAAANIDARVFFWPLSSLPMFHPRKENANAWSIPERSINLPSYHDLTEEDQERVIQTLLTATSMAGSAP
jgi:perosamine synthetase